jgi:hypothetical protein
LPDEACFDAEKSWINAKVNYNLEALGAKELKKKALDRTLGS